jgi:hypothetical protein
MKEFFDINSVALPNASPSPTTLCCQNFVLRSHTPQLSLLGKHLLMLIQVEMEEFNTDNIFDQVDPSHHFAQGSDIIPVLPKRAQRQDISHLILLNIHQRMIPTIHTTTRSVSYQVLTHTATVSRIFSASRRV